MSATSLEMARPLHGTGRGFSLLEVLLACSLMLLGLGLAVQVFLPLGRSAAHTSARAAQQQEASLVLRFLHADLAASSPRGLQSAPPYWRIQTINNLAPDGSQLWNSPHQLYRLQNECLTRLSRPDSSDTLDPDLSPADFAAAFQQPKLRQLSTQVKSFSLRDLADGTALVEIQVGSYRLCESRAWMLR